MDNHGFCQSVMTCYNKKTWYIKKVEKKSSNAQKHVILRVIKETSGARSVLRSAPEYHSIQTRKKRQNTQKHTSEKLQR